MTTELIIYCDKQQHTRFTKAFTEGEKEAGIHILAHVRVSLHVIFHLCVEFET